MDQSKQLYEPKLMDRLTSRYRDFETDEAVRRLLEAGKKLKKSPPPPQPKRQTEAA